MGQNNMQSSVPDLGAAILDGDFKDLINSAKANDADKNKNKNIQSQIIKTLETN